MNTKQNVMLKRMIVFLMMLFSVCFAYGNETENTKIKVAFPLIDGFHIVDEHRNISGYNYEYLMKIAQYVDWEYEFIIIDEATTNDSLNEAMRMVYEGEADLLGGMNYTIQSAEFFEYCMVPAGLNRYTISVLDTTQAFNTESYYSNDEFMIALDASNELVCERVLQYFEVNDITPLVIYMESQQECVNALYDGSVDAIVSKEISEFTDLIHLAQFSSELFYFVTTPGKEAFAKELTDAMTHVQHNEPYTNDLLKEKYFTNAHTGLIQFTAEDMAFFDEIGTVSVGFLPDTEPFYLASENPDTHQGISVDILKEVSTFLPIHFELIPFGSKTELLQEIQNGTIDMVATLPANYELANMIDVVLTLPYLTSNALRLTAENHEEFLENPIIYTHFIADQLDNSKVHEDLHSVIRLLEREEDRKSVV